MTITWKDSFKIGIAEIDAQHRELFSRLDRLETALRDGKGREIVFTTFQFLDNYVQRHFRAEEALQTLYRYPHLPMHTAEHDAFKIRLKALEERLTLEDPSEKLATQIRTLLTNWLITHVTNLDKELTGYINEARTKQWEEWLVSQF